MYSCLDMYVRQAIELACIIIGQCSVHTVAVVIMNS